MKQKTKAWCGLVLATVFSVTLAHARDFRGAIVHPMDYPASVAMKHMGEEISAATKGKYGLKVYPSSSLGSAKDAIEQVKIGAIDMTWISGSDFNQMLPETVIPNLPFLFRDIEHFRKVMYGPVGDEILAAFDKHGFIALCMYEAGARSLYAKKPIRTVADVKGMKIRVQPSDLWVSLVGAMGATATPIPYAEVYTALKTGLVDAAENNYPSYETSKHYEAAPIYSETEHVMAPDVVVFSKKVWETLTKEEQAIIRKAAKDSVPYFTKLWVAKEEASQEVAKKAGATFVTDVKKAEFVAVMKPVWDKFSPTPELKALTQRIVITKYNAAQYS